MVRHQLGSGVGTEFTQMMACAGRRIRFKSGINQSVGKELLLLLNLRDEDLLSGRCWASLHGDKSREKKMRTNQMAGKMAR